MQDILSQYGFDEQTSTLTRFGNGLINHTWLLEAGGRKYIFQKINDKVFKSPDDIAYNIRVIEDHLKEQAPEYLFVAPLHTRGGANMVHTNEGYFRIFPFIEGSHTIDVPGSSTQAYEAAKQFGAFAKNLSRLDPNSLKITLPGFHDLSLRFHQFEYALLHGNEKRIHQSKKLIEFVREQRKIDGEFEFHLPDLRVRCMHHDTKISNVLFDQQD